MIERKVYNGYAFSENEKEKIEINRKIYEELKNKYKICKVSESRNGFEEPTKEDLEKNDIVYSRKACYLHGEYEIYKCPEEVSFDELSLICDRGNLYFGSYGNKNFIIISED